MSIAVRAINKQKLAKAIIYRIYSSLITFIISYILTQNLVAAVSIGVLDSIVKIFSYYFFDEIWAKFTGFKATPSVIFLTGLSGSGKTTIARELMLKLKKKGAVPVLLDGDEIRNAIKLTGFDEESRKKHNLNVGYIASLFEAQGNIVIVSLISPYDDIRNKIREMCKNFIEVYVSTDIKVCMERDVKGLYAKAIKGEIKDFTGISAPYYPPNNPEVTIDTGSLSVRDCVNKIYSTFRK
jgi:adenylylsulfate kinase